MMEPLDIQALAASITEEMEGRLASLHIPDQAYEEAVEIIRDFNKIAASMLQEEPGLEMPGAPEPIPLDDKLATQTLNLFSEGVSFAILKCVEMGITGDTKKTILQNMALEVYNQAKQIMACTYGQEHTPEFQFSYEQQVNMMTQSAESNLMFFIGEYEKEYGPILVADTPPVMPLQTQPMAEIPPLAEITPPALPEAMPAPLALPTPMPVQPVGSHREKYAAVALLLTTLPTEQRGRILKSFSAEEKDLITYYSYPQHIQQELNISHVQAHLRNFKDRLKKTRSSKRKSDAYQGIARWAAYYPREKLLSWVSDERPLVKRYLESHYYATTPLPARYEGVPGKKPKARPKVHLPPRIEDILYRHLERRVEMSASTPFPG